MTGVFTAYVDDLHHIYDKHSVQAGFAVDKVLTFTGAKHVVAKLRDLAFSRVQDTDAALFLLTGITQKELLNIISHCPLDWWRIMVEHHEDTTFTDKPYTDFAQGGTSLYLPKGRPLE